MLFQMACIRDKQKKKIEKKDNPMVGFQNSYTKQLTCKYARSTKIKTVGQIGGGGFKFHKDL